MAEKITYYAIINDFSGRERPGGVLRRVEDDEGQNDEVFSRNLRWEHTPLLYSYERGDTMNDLIPIGEDQANQIVERIRRQVTDPGEAQSGA
jgi:hypothetical protein